MFTKPSRNVHRVFIHCSASDHSQHDNIDTMRAWHKARGFYDVGYHFFIRKDGSLEYGRDIEKTPAAQKGHNLNTLAICLHGLKEEKFTEQQFDTLKKLAQQIDHNYKNISFHGHCEVSAKACPVFNYKKVLNLDLYGSLDKNSSMLNNIKLKEASSLPELKLGSRGEAVEFLQQLLFIKIDGIFGPQTSRSIKSFKKLHKLYKSDLVKSHIWKLLMENERVED
ncbi:Phage lysin, N-acetylmuramoyl-L-alanine amidase |uniref:Phage lysin, N-acetylmuramoyl-L-alanine amidase \